MMKQARLHPRLCLVPMLRLVLPRAELQLSRPQARALQQARASQAQVLQQARVSQQAQVLRQAQQVSQQAQ